jgi:hypothetical protein
MAKNCASHICAIQTRAAKTRPTQIRVAERCARQISAAQNSMPHLAARQICAAQISIAQLCERKISAPQIGLAKLRLPQIGVREIITAQTYPIQLRPAQVGSDFARRTAMSFAPCVPSFRATPKGFEMCGVGHLTLEVLPRLKSSQSNLAQDKI